MSDHKDDCTFPVLAWIMPDHDVKALVKGLRGSAKWAMRVERCLLAGQLHAAADALEDLHEKNRKLSVTIIEAEADWRERAEDLLLEVKDWKWKYDAQKRRAERMAEVVEAAREHPMHYDPTGEGGPEDCSLCQALARLDEEEA